MKAFKTTHYPWSEGTSGLVFLLGLGWPSSFLRELLNAFALASVILAVFLISLHLLGTSVHEEAGKRAAKASVAWKFPSHVSHRLDTTRTWLHNRHAIHAHK
jgi:hypothetical protein